MTFAADVADVVVIGGGAAGCALAHRISADPSVRVLLLEAGPDERPDLLSAPARWPETLGGRYDYGYISTPQAAVGGRVVPAPRGRVLGGTTRLNAMIFSFPTEEDLEDWGPLWSRDTVEPSLRAMESHGGPTPGRGAAGPVRNRPARPGHTLCASFVDAAVEAGHPHCEDLNAPGARGAGWFDLTIDDDGSRVDASSSYLDGVRDRDNLQVWADCRVSRLNLSADRVTALTLERRGVPQTLAISGEVVLSAGAIDSPALLLRSGIGPPARNWRRPASPRSSTSHRWAATSTTIQRCRSCGRPGGSSPRRHSSSRRRASTSRTTSARRAAPSRSHSTTWR